MPYSIPSCDLCAGLMRWVEAIATEYDELLPTFTSEYEITAWVHRALLRDGLYSLLTPAEYGGLEVPLIVAMKVWEAIAKIDSSAGWVVAQAGAGLQMLAQMPQSGVDRIFSSSDQPVFAGAAFPPGKAVKTDDGLRVNARVPFASGCRTADWLYIPAIVMNGDTPAVDSATGLPDVRLCFFPRQDIIIHDTWHVLGLCGTESADIEVEDVFVSEEMTVSCLASNTSTPAKGFNGPLYRMGPWPVINGEAVTALGVASVAIDSLLELVATKVPAMNKVCLRDRELVQAAAGRARSLVESARYYLYGTAEQAYDMAAKGATLSKEIKISLQLANCHAARACAEAVDLVFDVAGTSSIRNELPFQRYFRDIHVITQHVTKSTMRYASAGKMMFGLDPDVPHLAR